VPWEDDPAAKLPMDYLVDIGADIAEYLAQIKNDHEIDYTQLRTQVAGSLIELNTWWCVWEAEHAQSVREVPSNQITNIPIFDTLLEYDALWTAYIVCIYNTIRILLLQTWHRLHKHCNSIRSVDMDIVLDMSNSTVLLGITSDTLGLACEILRSLNYCYRMSRSFTITFAFLFIQEVAYSCLDRGSIEAEWAAAHGWAELVDSHDIQDANLLLRLLPMGKIKSESATVPVMEPLTKS